MVEFSAFRALQGLAKLSGSFAVSGLVAGSAAHSRAHQAFAYTDPLYLPFKELPYPVRRASGKIVKTLPNGRPDIEYPVEDLLKSPWDTFLPEAVARAFLKSFGIYSAIYLQGWIQAFNEAEHEAKEQARLNGEPVEDVDVDMPEITWREVVHVLQGSVRGGIRDLSTTCIRRVLEWKFSKRLSGRISWKLVKDFAPSARRKLQKHSHFTAMWLTARTAMRSCVLIQMADFIFSTTMDTYRLLVVPFLPESWQRRLGLRRYGFAPARLPPAQQPPAHLPHAQVPPPQRQEDIVAQNAVIPAENEAAPAPVEDQPAAQLAPPPEAERHYPALWSWRFGMLAKKAVGNAARCCVSLSAGSIGAGLTAGILPITILVLACNGAEMVVSIFVTSPELDDWYEQGRLPWKTFTLALLSSGILTLVLLQASTKRI